MMSKWHGFWIILKKEIIDNCRDRRTLTTMGISIIIAPMMLLGFIWFIDKTVNDETDLVTAEAIELPVIGAELAPNLMAWLQQNNIKIVAPPINPEQAVANGEFKVVLVIDNSFVEKFELGNTAPLRLIYDSSVAGLEGLTFSAVQSAISRYSGKMGSMRLIARGISPEVVKPININLSDVASPEARNSEILTMLPYLLIIFIMVGGMYLAIDTTAGEREHGSLEPLLTQPVSRHIILLAKLGATITFSAITFLLVLIGLSFAFQNVPIESITIVISAWQIVKIFVICLPFVFVGCAFMVLIASFTKSYKEAQSYLSMVMIIPALPLMVLMMLSPEPAFSNMWAPSFSQGLIVLETLKGETVDSQLIALSMISSTIFSAALSFIAVKFYQRERILG